MKQIYLYTRKHSGKEYKFFANVPQWKGEKGICGVEIEPYVSVTTDPNCFGYTDTILLSSSGQAYGVDRYHPKSVLEKLARQMERALTKFLDTYDMDYMDYAE